VSEFLWATVTQIGPLRVKIDGDAAALLFAPESLVDVATLAVNDRVRVELSGTRILIHGSAGSSFYTRAQVDTAFYTKTQLNAGQLDSRYYTESEIDNLFKKSQQGQIPSTVVVGSGSASVAADGTVTATGCSSVSLNDIFDGLGSEIYQLIADGDTSTSSIVTFRQRSGGSDISTSSHVYVGLQSSLSAGPARSSSTSANSFGFLIPTSVGSANVKGSLLLFGPGKSTATFYKMDSFAAAAGDRYLWTEGGNTPSGARTGISLICSAGTYTGTLKVVKLG